jgi:hypothetical protein
MGGMGAFGAIPGLAAGRSAIPFPTRSFGPSRCDPRYSAS